MAKRKLSIQQQRRINRKHRAIEAEMSSSEERTGIVVSRFGKQADVMVTENGEPGKIYRCHIRANVQDIVTGDRVSWLAGDPTGVITSSAPRDTLMSRPDSRGQLRPVAANVTQIAVVIAPEPHPHQNLVDRYLVAIEHFDIHPLLVVNKIDLKKPGDAHLDGLIQLYQQLAYPVFQVSARSGENLGQLCAALNHQSTVFVGQSGVGKSSLVNLICPEAEAAVSKLSQIAKGRHTTTTAALYPLPSGGYLIDSPGIREFGLWHLDKSQIARGFIEFRPFLGQCRFRNCLHREEPGCSVIEAAKQDTISASRLASYQRIVDDLNQG